MPTTPIEEIPLGPLHIRFFVDGTAAPNGSISMFDFTVAPGARVPIAHSHDAYEETLYALEGNLTLTLWSNPGEPTHPAVAPQRIETAPGDVVLIPRGVVHRFDNFSSAPTRTLAIITPGILGAAYFREIGALLAPNPAAAAMVAAKEGKPAPPDPAAVAQIMLRHGLTPAPGR